MFVCLKVVSISPWQHSSKAKPVRGLCLTSLFNQTQTHTSGQPGPRYLSLPPSARCTHPALSSSSSSIPSLPPLSLSPLLTFPPLSHPRPLVQHPCASHCLPPLHRSLLPVSCSLYPLQAHEPPPPPSYPHFSGLLSLLWTWLRAQKEGLLPVNWGRTGWRCTLARRRVRVCDTRTDIATQIETQLHHLQFVILPYVHTDQTWN